MNIQLLAEQNLEFLSLKGGCTGWPESTFVKMQHCWKSHVTAQFIFILKAILLCTALYVGFSGSSTQVFLSISDIISQKSWYIVTHCINC